MLLTVGEWTNSLATLALLGTAFLMGIALGV